MRVFLSKILSDVLPVAEGIKSRGMKIDITCQVCGDGSESVNHLFLLVLSQEECGRTLICRLNVRGSIILLFCKTLSDW